MTILISILLLKYLHLIVLVSAYFDVSVNLKDYRCRRLNLIYVYVYKKQKISGDIILDTLQL